MFTISKKKPKHEIDALHIGKPKLFFPDLRVDTEPLLLYLCTRKYYDVISPCKLSHVKKENPAASLKPICFHLPILAKY